MSEHQALSSEQLADSSQPQDDAWRKEIHARVAGYRSRRGRRVEGEFSMRFPFPPSETIEAAVIEDPALEATESTCEPFEEIATAGVPSPEAEPVEIAVGAED